MINLVELLFECILPNPPQNVLLQLLAYRCSFAILRVVVTNFVYLFPDELNAQLLNEYMCCYYHLSSSTG